MTQFSFDRVRLTLAGVFAVAFGIWAFLTFSGAFQGLDVAGVSIFRVEGDTSDAVGSPWFEKLVVAITHAGDSLTLIVVSVFALGWLYFKKEKQLAIWLFVTNGIAFGITPLLKAAFGRARPDIVEQLVHAGSPSFPSGHALRSAVIYFALVCVFSRLGKFESSKTVFKAAACLLVAMVGLSRVYLGVHWPSDIIAGWLVAATWLTLMSSMGPKPAE